LESIEETNDCAHKSSNTQVLFFCSFLELFVEIVMLSLGQEFKVGSSLRESHLLTENLTVLSGSEGVLVGLGFDVNEVGLGVD
jgi:hypothetical protein